jgi:hypothetical protein
LPILNPARLGTQCIDKPSRAQPKKKPPEGGFDGSEKITSSLQQVRLQEQERQQVRRCCQQQVRQQVQERVLQQQARGLLFCHKQRGQRPRALPRAEIFSWGISFNRDKTHFKGCRQLEAIQAGNRAAGLNRPSTQPSIIGEFATLARLSRLTTSG